MSLASIDNVMRRAFGLGVKPIASTYAVYRLGGASGEPNFAASLIDPLNLVFPAYPARITRGLPKILIEVEELYKMIYIGFLDTRPLKIGDCLVENGPPTTDSPDGRMYLLADVQPMLPPQFPRVEIQGNLARPSTTTPDLMQGAGAYSGGSKFTSQICVLNNGMYSFSESGIAATIPMGLQPYARRGPGQDKKFPMATHRTQHYIYIPLLPGVEVLPGDEITDNNGNRYVVDNLSSFTVGLQGTLAIADSLFT